MISDGLGGFWLHKHVSLHNKPPPPGFPLCVSGFLSLVRVFIQANMISYEIPSHLQGHHSHRRSNSEFLKLMPVHSFLGDNDTLQSYLSVFSLSLAAG